MSTAPNLNFDPTPNLFHCLSSLPCRICPEWSNIQVWHCHLLLDILLGLLLHFGEMTLTSSLTYKVPLHLDECKADQSYWSFHSGAANPLGFRKEVACCELHQAGKWGKRAWTEALPSGGGWFWAEREVGAQGRLVVGFKPRSPWFQSPPMRKGMSWVFVRENSFFTPCESPMWMGQECGRHSRHAKDNSLRIKMKVRLRPKN